MNKTRSLLLFCNICQESWKTRYLKKPRKCPRCQSIDWDKTRNDRYYFDKISINETISMPWIKRPDGSRDMVQNPRRAVALNAFIRRHPEITLHVAPTPYGLIIKRKC